MKIVREHLINLIREELSLVLYDDFGVELPDSTDAWHPSEVKPLEDAWSGGDNIDSPVDHSYVETGESNAAPHNILGFSGTPEDTEEGECVDQNFSPPSRKGLIDLVFLREADDIIDAPAPALGDLIEPVVDVEPEREDIIIRILGDMEEAGLTGPTGLMQHVDNVDEFEDLIRFIFNDVRLDNRQLASVAMSIAKDFLEDPESAPGLSTFNL